MEFPSSKIVAVCNITPNSFSGDGWLVDANEYQRAKLSIEFQESLTGLVKQGADVVDVGAESTAPGSESVSVEEEQRRLSMVLQTIKVLKSDVQLPCEFSVDTVNASTAKLAVEHGFTIVNDVSGGRNDTNMFKVIADNPSIKYIMMYCKNASGRADTLDNQSDVLDKIYKFFDSQVELALSQGVRKEQLVLDPGMGAFISAKAEDSLEVLRKLPEFRARYQMPVLVGASRKGFLTKLSRYDFGAKSRIGLSMAAALFAVEQGADYLRVHDVLATRQFLDARKVLRPNAE
eukprot:TRINITY_DN24431_c0_g1_i1.p1 TRINITY_DN24431_c0_g1~~TRINITY_DN24431_c0_g1_i1.p1  ORF type:complete len:311 (+),score=69.77 TRINITY_DN24431_c0_g1_i1:65-934(+)